MRNYIVSVVFGLVLMGGLIAAAFTAAARSWPGVMPPPAISGSVATDEKLRYCSRPKMLRTFGQNYCTR